MTAEDIERFHRTEALFDAALKYNAGPERDEFLLREASADPALLASVRRLLAVDERVTSAVPSPPEALPAFGTWQAIKLLGRGGMGVVYLAERADGTFKMQAAVKVVPLALASADIEERFRRERQFLASLEHPKVARLIDGGVTSAGLPYLVMEYVAGLPIDRYCDEHHLDLRARVGLMRQVLQALTYVHGRQVIHRDLKSSNILVDSAGSARLLDFGTARLVHAGDAAGSDNAITRSGVFAFTPECASPEQVRAKPLTFATDIYSAGVLLYRLLTGRAPYRLPHDPSGLAHTIACTPPEPAGLDGPLDAILQKALRKKPEERYSSAALLDADLARYLNGQAVSARRRASRILTLAAVSALVAGAFAIAWWGKQLGGAGAVLAQAPDQYLISTVAGDGNLPFSRSGTAALHADLVLPQYVAADAAGNIFVTDVYYQQVFRLSPGGIITVFAGTGRPGFGGDNGPAAAAQFNNPLGVAADRAGNVFIMDNGNARLRKVAPDGTVTTVASVLGGSIALDAAGNIYVSQSLVNKVHKVSPGGAVTTFAGTGQAGAGGDGGPAAEAQLSKPAGLRFDSAGNLYIADTGNHKVRKITPQGIISTLAGRGDAGLAGDEGPAREALLRAPADVAPGMDGSIYIADNGNGRIRVVRPDGTIATIIGGASRDALNIPIAVDVDRAGSIIVVAEADHQVRRLSRAGLTTIAGAVPRDGASDNIPAASARLLLPSAIAIDDRGNIFIADVRDKCIRRVDWNGVITTVLAQGTPGFAGIPRTLALDRDGTLYFSEANAIRRLAADGTVEDLARLPDSARPECLAASDAGDLYVADSGSHRIWRIAAGSREISPFAGTGKADYNGDRGPARAASLSSPSQLALDRHGNLYVADTNNNRIRKVSPDGVIVTVAGCGIYGDAGDGGDPIAAQLSQPSGVAVDFEGNLYIGSLNGARIRKVSHAKHTIETIAGTGVAGFGGDGGPAVAARIDSPHPLALDRFGNLYFVDATNQRLRKLTPR